MRQAPAAGRVGAAQVARWEPTLAAAWRVAVAEPAESPDYPVQQVQAVQRGWERAVVWGGSAELETQPASQVLREQEPEAQDNRPSLQVSWSQVRSTRARSQAQVARCVGAATRGVS